MKSFGQFLVLFALLLSVYAKNLKDQRDESRKVPYEQNKEIIPNTKATSTVDGKTGDCCKYKDLQIRPLAKVDMDSHEDTDYKYEEPTEEDYEFDLEGWLEILGSTPFG